MKATTERKAVKTLKPGIAVNERSAQAINPDVMFATMARWIGPDDN